MAWAEWRSVPEFHFIGILIKKGPALPIDPISCQRSHRFLLMLISKWGLWAPLPPGRDWPSTTWTQSWNLKFSGQYEKENGYTLRTRMKRLHSVSQAGLCLAMYIDQARQGPCPHGAGEILITRLYLTKTSFN